MVAAGAMNCLSLFRGQLSLRAMAFVKAPHSLPRSLPFFHSSRNFRRTMSSISATDDEEASARTAAANADTGAPTIFDKIIAKEIPSNIVYEDEKAEQRHGEILGHLLYAAKIVAEQEGIIDGFRVVINSGPTACQSVYHLHLHVLGGRQMKWPPG